MLLVLRLWALQVLNTRTFVAQAASNHEKQVVVRAPRGEILDARAACSCATASPTSSTSTPAPCATPRAAISCCCAWPRCSTCRRARSGSGSTASCAWIPSRPVTLATDIDVKLKWYLQENPSIFHGLSVAQVPLRFYPYRTLGAHIYGQLSEIGPKQLQDPRFHDYHRGDVIGQSGVERRYDAFLRGTDGIDAVTVDAFGQPTGAVRHVKAPVPGRNVRLTIDLDTQRAAEQALAKGVRGAASAGRRRRRDRGDGPVQRRDPRARLLSHVRPQLVHLVPQAEVQAQLTRITREGGAPAHYPLLDRAIAGRYPAASTFKPFVAIAAVKERRITPDQSCPARRRPTTTTRRSTTGTDVRRPHQPDHALERSCDTYFYRLGDLIFREGGKQGHPLQNWASKFGFGKKHRHRHRRRG